MAMPGETVRRGAPHPGTHIKIMQTFAGWYLGYENEDGEPYSRESEYYDRREELLMAIERDEVRWR